MTNSMRASSRARRAVPLSGRAAAFRRADRRRIQAAAPDERALSAAPRLHAAHRRALRHAGGAAVAHAGAYRAQIRQGLRPFHHAAEHPVQLAQAGRRARHAGRSRHRRDACDPDERQLHPQRHRRSFRRRSRDEIEDPRSWPRSCGNGRACIPNSRSCRANSRSRCPARSTIAPPSNSTTSASRS